MTFTVTISQFQSRLFSLFTFIPIHLFPLPQIAFVKMNYFRLNDWHKIYSAILHSHKHNSCNVQLRGYVNNLTHSRTAQQILIIALFSIYSNKIFGVLLEYLISILFYGYWHQTADERHDNPPQGNQELLVIKDKVGRPQVIGVSKSMDCDISLQCFYIVGWATGMVSGL